MSVSSDGGRRANVFCRSDSCLEQIALALSPVLHAENATDPAEFRTRLQTAAASVLAWDSSVVGSERGLLRQIVFGPHANPDESTFALVLVELEAGKIQRDGGSVPSRPVVPGSRIAALLTETVEQEAARAALHRSARLIASVARDALLREAITYLFIGERVVRTKKQLARVMRCHEKTLKRHWESFVRPHRDYGIELDDIGWAVLLRARAARAAGRRSGAGAGALGLPERYIANLSRRLTGATLGANDARGWWIPLEMSEATLLRALGSAM